MLLDLLYGTAPIVIGAESVKSRLTITSSLSGRCLWRDRGREAYPM